MRKLYISVFFAIFCIGKYYAQLTTSSALTPQQLVQNILLGSGVTASNITYTGNINAIGNFSATASTSLGIPSGVIMTSGRASGTAGVPGNVSLTASTDNGLPGDADLNAVIPNTRDACILEFDFVPQGDTLSFRYVFGSDEYPTYVCSNYADVFAYLVSGPNPSGGNYNKINIATIPGTSIPVSINSINSGSPGSGYQSSGCLSTAYNSLFVNNVSSANGFIKYNGMSRVLRAKLPVICGQTYHIKMGIADVFDGTLDSGVFLEGGSFSSVPPLNLNTTNANSLVPDSILVEDCAITNCINFIRNGNIAVADSFALQTSGNAILGTDYIQVGNPSFAWPSKLVFAPGQDTIKVCGLSALQDNLTEGVDTIKFTMSSFVTNTLSCLASNQVQFNLYVIDYIPISIGQNDVTLCSGSSTILNASASFGYPAYSYTISSPSVNTPTLNTGPITSTTIYTITVNDVCEKAVTKQITVTPVAIPTVTVNDTIVCAGNAALLYASGATTYSWSSGASTSTAVVTPTSTTNYTVVGSVGSCTNSAVTTVTVVGQPISVTGLNNICAGQSTTLTASNGLAYNWNTGQTTNAIVVTPTITTTYTVTSIVATCTNMAIYTVSVTQNPIVAVSGNSTCPGQSTTLNAFGASSYVWSTGATTNTISVSPLVNTSYTVTGTVFPGCSNETIYTVTVVPTPTITTAGGGNLCGGSTATLIASGANTYTWSTGVASQSITVSPTSTTNYTVVGSVGSCTSSAVATASVITPSVTISGNNNLCLGQSTLLTATGGTLFAWNNGATTSTIMVTPTVTTSYTVTSYVGLCSTTNEYTVMVTPQPTINISGTTICPGQPAVLTATGATTYTWSTGATTPTIVVNPIVNTTYTVTGSSIPMCNNTATYNVNVITSQPVLDPINPRTFCLDSLSQIRLVVTSGNTPYQFSLLIPSNGTIPYDTLSNIFYITQSGLPTTVTYTAIVTDQCMFQDSITVEIELVDCTIIIPNVVTPNGDGVNDVFKINGLDNFSGSILNVFNRWGNSIYQSDDYKNDWSPNVNSGAYFYVLNISDGRKFSGFFQVFKD